MANTTSKEERIKFENYFARLFPSLILKNKIVSTILYTFMCVLAEENTKIEKRTTTDI